MRNLTLDFQRPTSVQIAPLSGFRILVDYSLVAESETAATRIADAIALEQSAEFPRALIPDDVFETGYVGLVEELRADSPRTWTARISFPVEMIEGGAAQFLNVLFGNTSLQSGVRLVDFAFPEAYKPQFKGPRFGIEGIRELVKAPQRVITCTALKPQGLPAAQLAAHAFDFAVGGIDIIKDDHGFGNQSYSPFHERVKAVTAAVHRANANTGGHSLYAPHVVGSQFDVIAQAKFAADHGAGALLVSPGLVGFETLTLLREDPSIRLPLIVHPAFTGGFVSSTGSGIAHGLWYGLLPRIFGADATIFPHAGGRFAFSLDDCVAIAEASRKTLAPFKAAFPVPAGGMTVERCAELVAAYGRDFIALIGGGLHSLGPDLRSNAEHFRALAESL